MSKREKFIVLKILLHFDIVLEYYFYFLNFSFFLLFTFPGYTLWNFRWKPKLLHFISKRLFKKNGIDIKIMSNFTGVYCWFLWLIIGLVVEINNSESKLWKTRFLGIYFVTNWRFIFSKQTFLFCIYFLRFRYILIGIIWIKNWK